MSETITTVSSALSNTLLRAYFKEISPLVSNINSFNNFIERRLQEIIKNNSNIEPTIIPSNIDKFVIRLDKIVVSKPEITEADGSKRDLYPREARLRNLSYSAPMFLDVSVHINGIQRESFTTQIGNMPIMIKSKFCHLSKLNRDELISKGEDGDDPGGYFIINGTEKVLIHIEDLAPNRFMVELDETGKSFNGRIFSEQGSYRIPHSIERLSDGIAYLSFTRLKRMPLFLILKALGMTKDEDIVKVINEPRLQDEIFVNLYDFVSVKTDEDAMDALARRMGITQTRDIRLERMSDMLDRFLLPHLGVGKEFRIVKARNLCKYFKQSMLVLKRELKGDDMDHYMNKRIKMSGDLLADLFETNLRVLIDDLVYNFQRIVKRGKFPSIKVIIRDKLLTSRIYSAMATGVWVGGRKGISQRMQRWNYLEALSHMQRVVSPLSVTQENFEARALHPTHFGRLCPIETPEGTNIGLRKNLALLAEVSLDADEKEVQKQLEAVGLRVAK